MAEEWFDRQHGNTTYREVMCAGFTYGGLFCDRYTSTAVGYVGYCWQHKTHGTRGEFEDAHKRLLEYVLDKVQAGQTRENHCEGFECSRACPWEVRIGKWSRVLYLFPALHALADELHEIGN